MIDKIQPENICDKNKNLRISCKEDIIVIITDHKWYQVGEVKEEKISHDQDKLNVPDVIVKVNASKLVFHRLCKKGLCKKVFVVLFLVFFLLSIGFLSFVF